MASTSWKRLSSLGGATGNGEQNLVIASLKIGHLPEAGSVRAAVPGRRHDSDIRFYGYPLCDCVLCVWETGSYGLKNNHNAVRVRWNGWATKKDTIRKKSLSGNCFSQLKSFRFYISSGDIRRRCVLVEEG